MKITVAQTRPVCGDLDANLRNHHSLVTAAAKARSDVILFSELSLTGYEPTLASALAIDIHDERLEPLQRLSDSDKMTICAGAPIKTNAGVQIGLVIFQPLQPRTAYAKHFLHADEMPFFVPGESATGLIGSDPVCALAICYEISVEVHAERAATAGASVYAASVAKTLEGIEKAQHRLCTIATTHSMSVVMANSIGPADNFICGGRSAVWNRQGIRLAELDCEREGFLVWDTHTEELLSVKQLPAVSMHQR